MRLCLLERHGEDSLGKLLRVRDDYGNGDTNGHSYGNGDGNADAHAYPDCDSDGDSYSNSDGDGDPDIDGNADSDPDPDPDSDGNFDTVTMAYDPNTRKGTDIPPATVPGEMPAAGQPGFSSAGGGGSKYKPTPEEVQMRQGLEQLMAERGPGAVQLFQEKLRGAHPMDHLPMLQAELKGGAMPGQTLSGLPNPFLQESRRPVGQGGDQPVRF